MKDLERLKRIIELCLEKPIELDTFSEMCEDYWEQIPLFSKILDNIESQLEHLSINGQKYYDTDEYFIMKKDLDLLNKFGSLDESDILKIRMNYVR